MEADVARTGGRQKFAFADYHVKEQFSSCYREYLSYDYLLLSHAAGHFNKLHSISQGFWYCFHLIGYCDKGDATQIKCDV